MDKTVNHMPMFDKVDDNQSYTSKLKFCNYKLNWTIEDFDFICKNVKLIESPKFPKNSLKNGHQWFLQLQPTELKEENKTQFHILFKSTADIKRHVNVRIGFHNSNKTVYNLITTSLLLDNIYWNLTGSELYNNFGKIVPKNILVTCEVSVFDSGTSIIEKPLIDSPKCNDLLENIENLYQDEDFKDVTFVVGRKKFTAHKAILARRSSVFAEMFKSKKREELTSIFKITDPPTVFENILRFIYTDKVENLNENVILLYAGAKKYQLEKLKTMCINSLYKNLSSKTVLSTLKMANAQCILKLKNKCILHLNTDYKFVKDTQEFVEFTRTYRLLSEEITKTPIVIDSAEKDDEKLNLTFRV